MFGEFLGRVATIDDLNDCNVDGFRLLEGNKYWNTLRTMWKWCHEQSLLAVGPTPIGRFGKGGAA